MNSNFLKLVSVDEAIRIAESIAHEVESETVPIDEAVGRILAKDVLSDVNIPGFDKSWKDGYAVIASETENATESLPAMLKLTGRISMGVGEKKSIKHGECLNIPTGAQMPEGADAVVMLEYTDEVEGDILVKRPVAVGENVIYAGEDFAEGKTVFKAGRVLSSSDLGALAAVGCFEVPVKRRVVVGIIATGIEIIPVSQKPKAGEIRDVNSYLCSGFVKRYGCIPKQLGIVRDDCDSMIELLKKAASECDLILITGGSSKDIRDVTAQAIYSVGEVFVHGITLAPGKPTIIGKIGETAVVGIPGHPAATYMVLSVLVRHLIAKIAGYSKEYDALSVQKAILTTNISSEKGREEYVRAKIVKREGDDTYVTALFGKSGLLNTIIESDGVIKIDAGCEGIEAGERVEVYLW